MNPPKDSDIQCASAPAPGFLINGGMIASLIQRMDWSASPLGHPQAWSLSLKTLMGTLLPAQAQIVLFWGPEYVALYNDAYAPTIGAKHPHALGRPAIEYWRELWDDLEPLLRRVRETGETYAAKDRPFYIQRSGVGETVYFDVSYSAVREADGSIGGVLCIVTETTARVQFERRQAFLLALGKVLPDIAEADAIEAHVIERLGEELGASRVWFGEDLGDEQRYRIARDWVSRLPSACGEQCWANEAPGLRDGLQAGHSLLDGEILGVLPARGACLKVPLLRGGALEAMLCVEFDRLQVFAEDHCRLVEEAAKVAWSAILHARAQHALRASSAHLEATLQELMTLNATLEERVASILAEREADLMQLHEARKMETVGQLTGGIAHDFNNMLTPIIATLELIARRPHDAARATRLIDGALQAADRARSLVGRMLSFGRRQTLKPQAVSLAALVSDMHELITRALGPTIDVQVQIDPGLPAVLVDPHQLEVALLNLVVNARDAMCQGGKLKISAGAGGEREDRPAALGSGPVVWLDVADTGCGMSQEVLEHCFEPFYSTKGIGKGTGLGLPMVQGLSLQSGGDFAIRSQLGEGTVATLWLPLSDERGQAPLGGSGDSPITQRPLKVLLVDDEALVRQVTAMQLRDLGYQVTEAGSAAQALELIAQGLAPELLVTDQVMPEQTGVQLARSLRKRLPQLPVLIITGYANLTPREISGFDILRKPFRRAELAESLARLAPVDLPVICAEA
ncbi:response regulator [Pseudomonas sp. S75]|uniref:ATP-binding protein n=1 Tax=unclassified Pseudomonas TaxID=196821 RepID=UPI0019064D79|nr:MULTISPECIES: ATP-binding protein [unclassified Pseudomonas]MBJ9974279.1 response regulator [Pseudomonas sp. S30]MBK0151791.1 response regulator [Pseudomonas sp. S75]